MHVEKGRIYREAEHGHPEHHRRIYHFQGEKTARIRCVITYGLSDLSRQALSIPGNDITVSVSLAELGFWLLWRQKTNSEPQLKGKTDFLDIVGDMCTVYEAGDLGVLPKDRL